MSFFYSCNGASLAVRVFSLLAVSRRRGSCLSDNLKRFVLAQIKEPIVRNAIRVVVQHNVAGRSTYRPTHKQVHIPYIQVSVTSLTLNDGVLRSLEKSASVSKVATLVEHLASCVGVGLHRVVQEEGVKIGLKIGRRSRKLWRTFLEISACLYEVK